MSFPNDLFAFLKTLVSNDLCHLIINYSSVLEETEKVVVKKDNERKWSRGSYVNGIKHGHFKIYSSNNNTYRYDGNFHSSGMYKNDLKDGEWEYYYHYWNIYFRKKGEYENGVKIGIWDYYTNPGSGSKRYVGTRTFSIMD